MATNFPSSLDNLSNPTGSSALTSPDHAGQHADANDAIEALEAKVGVNGSAVTTSLDYKVENGVFPKLNVDSGVLFVDATNNRVGVNNSSPSTAVDVVGSATVRAASSQDGVVLAGRAGGSSSYTTTLTPATLNASRTITIPDRTGTLSLGYSVVSTTMYVGSGSYTPFPANAGIKGCRIYLVGAGGGGGGVSTTNAAGISLGLGGTAGAQVIYFYDTTKYDAYFAGMTFSIFCGAAGSGVLGGTGNSGGTTTMYSSSYQIFFSAIGGTGGAIYTTFTPPRVFLRENRASISDSSAVLPDHVTSFPIVREINALALSTSVYSSGVGGAADPFNLVRTTSGSDNGDPGVGQTSPLAGGAAWGYGHGGGGAANGVSAISARAGGAGANGYVIVELLA